MGNHPSHPSHSHSHSHSHSQPANSSHAQSHSHSKSQPQQARQHHGHSRVAPKQPSAAQPAFPLDSSSAGSVSSPSDTASFDHPLTPATSLSPSVSRVEAHPQRIHRHSSSLNSYLLQQPRAAPDAAMGAASSSEKLPKPRPNNQRDRTDSGSPRTIPVSVPTRQKSLRLRETTPKQDTPPLRSSGPPRDHETSASYAPPPPIYHHPPRLPLPIEQEELTPGSPVLTARDFNDVVPGIEGEDESGDDGLTPNKSLLSHGTADDEEESVGDPLEHDNPGSDAKRRTKPVTVTWIEPGEKVYVTGTFANWSKKYRMHRDPATGHAKTTLDLLPGMHHIRYIVDGDMRLREDSDQAVDYTNTLVNIIEVKADEVFDPTTAGKEQTSAESGTTDENIGGVRPPVVITPGVETRDRDLSAEASQPPSRGDPKASGPELMDISPRHYGQQVPSYLLDLDRDERSARFQRASSRVADIAAPPSLPGFLSKSILNGTMPMKDDSSVLNMPNHTVLNHLATSSIRQGVLATSLTTRYKRKYVTLITYRPTSLDE